jgi:hypothetical protein
MEFKKDNNFGDDFAEDSYREQNHNKGDLFVERERGEEEIEDELDSDVEEDLPSWGVYYQGKEKTLLGEFWDKELAVLFRNALEKSSLLEKVKEIA